MAANQKVIGEDIARPRGFWEMEFLDFSCRVSIYLVQSERENVFVT